MYLNYFSSENREQLINTVNEFCYRYTDGHFMEKCLQITKRLTLSGSRIISICPAGELAAGIIYTAGEGEEGNGMFGYRVSGEDGLKFICSFYSKPEFMIYGDYKNIKELLRIDMNHPYGIPDYRNPYPVIKIFGIGSVGIGGIRKLTERLEGSDFVCISDNADDLDSLSGCEKIMLSENNQGAIISECAEKIATMAKESDIVFILLEPGSIDVLEVQALGAFAKDDNLKIITLFEKNNPNNLTAALMINGMDASLKLQCSDTDFNLLCDSINTLYSFPIFENEFSSGFDFFSIKKLLKSSGAIKTFTASSSGVGRLVNALKICTSEIEPSTLKGIVVNIVGPIDMGLGEVQGAMEYLKNIFGSLPILYRSSINEDTFGEIKVTIISVCK